MEKSQSSVVIRRYKIITPNQAAPAKGKWLAKQVERVYLDNIAALGLKPFSLPLPAAAADSSPWQGRLQQGSIQIALLYLPRL